MHLKMPSSKCQPFASSEVEPMIFWENYPDSKVHGANMGPTWGRQDPGGPHVDHMNFAIWVALNISSNDIDCVK